MRIGDQGYKAVLVIGATLSIPPSRLLNPAKIRKTKTMAIRRGDGSTIHSVGEVDVTACLGDEQVTEHCRVLDYCFCDIVIETNLLCRNPQVKLLSLQCPHALDNELGSGLFYVPLEGLKKFGLRYLNQ